MKRIANGEMTKMALMAMMLIATSGIAFGESKYSKIKNGVGNILVGEELPYNNDAGYKNVVFDSVKFSKMRTWATFYYRAYFASKIKDIEHDIRVLVWHFEATGTRAAQFKREVGVNYIAVCYREDDSATYGERSEWSRAFTNAETFDDTCNLQEYLMPYDYSKPDSFSYRTTRADLGDKVNFTPETLEGWKDKYGLTALSVTLQAFSFVDGGDTTEGTNKTALSRNSDGDWEEKESLASVKTYTLWENMQYLATGEFTIAFD